MPEPQNSSINPEKSSISRTTTTKHTKQLTPQKISKTFDKLFNNLKTL